MRRLALFLSFVGLTAIPAAAQITNAATFGTVIPFTGSGTPSDIVLDSFRQRLYLINSSANRVDVFSTSTNQIIGSIAVGKGPLAGAISMDSAFLYVTNSTDKTLSVIDLGGMRVTQTVTMPAIPEGVEVGYDGRALVSLQSTTQGLIVFDQTQTTGLQITNVTSPPAPSTPSPLPATITTRPQTTFNDKLIRTPDGMYIIGITNPTVTGIATYLFVYEVASGDDLAQPNSGGAIEHAFDLARWLPLHGRLHHVRHGEPFRNRSAEQFQRSVPIYGRFYDATEYWRQRVLGGWEYSLQRVQYYPVHQYESSTEAEFLYLADRGWAQHEHQFRNSHAGKHRGENGDGAYGRYLQLVGFRVTLSADFEAVYLSDYHASYDAGFSFKRSVQPWRGDRKSPSE